MPLLGSFGGGSSRGFGFGTAAPLVLYSADFLVIAGGASGGTLGGGGGAGG